MPENFQQTVDLRNRLEKQRRPAPPKKAITPLEKIYQDQEVNEPKKDWQKISQPEIGRPLDGLIRLIVFILAILVIGATVYFLFFRAKSAADPAKANNWYAVKLVDGTVYYGQIFDLKANPLVIKNAYYNYDQAKQTDGSKASAKTIEETGNLRLVKRGKETQGGDGSIIVYPSNGWPIVEPLRTDSKVLQAILQYEK